MVMEVAIFRYRETPLVKLWFDNGRLVKKENYNNHIKRPDINWVYDYSLKEMEAFLLNRRISLGRPQRNERYFGGKQLTPYEEMKMYLAADLDDYCWLDYEGSNKTFSEVYGGII